MKFDSEIELTNWALDAASLWLFLDYDGTLVDFASSPDQIIPNPKVIEVLNQLARRSLTRVTIISGRKLHDIRILLPIAGIFLAGTYGIEMLTSDGETIHRIDYDDIRPVLKPLKQQWEHIIARRKGFFLEDKGWSLALHARFADESNVEEVFGIVRRTIDQQILTERFRILGGDKFLEIAPLLASKRETVKYLLNQFRFPQARCLYIGDDDKDEEAFPLIHAQGGIAIKVSQPSQLSLPTDADYILKSPLETIRWLGNLACS